MTEILSVDELARVLLDLSLKATVVLAVSWLLLKCFGKSSAAIRHRIASLTMIGLILLPLLPFLLPVWHWRVLPHREASQPLVFESFSTTVAQTNELPILQDRPAPAWVITDGSLLSERRSNKNSETLTRTSAPVVASVNQSTTPSFSWNSLLVGGWSLGVLVCLTRLANGLWQVRRLSWQSTVVTDSTWRNLIVVLCERLQLRKTVELRKCSTSTIPLTLGYLRPQVILPSDADRWTQEMRRIVLLHELVHVKRTDVAVQILGRLACALYWFHPLVWLTLRQLRADCEQACDDAVVHTGELASEYADLLLQVARLYAPPRGVAFAAEMARPTSLEQRMRSMFDAAKSHRPIGWRWALGILVVISFLFWAVTVVKPVSTVSLTDKTASTIAENIPTVNPKKASKGEPKQFTREGLFTISGRVIQTETDAPAESVPVYATGGADPAHTYEATTDSDGRYRLEVESDSYEIHASCKGFVCTPLIGQRANAGETLDVSDLKIEKGGYIGGKVVDQKTGQPVTTTRAGKPLFVAYTCWGNRRNYKEFGSVQVEIDGTYLLEVPLKSSPFVYLRDEAIAYSCEHEAFTPHVKSTELHQIDFEIVGPRNDAAFIPAPSLFDEVVTAENGEEVEVQVVLNELRKLHRTIRTGEFTAREEFVSLTPEGRQETIIADLRGVFDREHNLIRHEYRRRTPRLQRVPMDRINSSSSNSVDRERQRNQLLITRHALLDLAQRETNLTLQIGDPILKVPCHDQIVVVRNEFAAVAHDGQIDLDVKQWYQSFPERIPLDPISVGLSPYIREPSYSPDERKNKLQSLAAFEEFLFKKFDPEAQIHIEIRAFRVRGYVVLLRKVDNPKQGLKGFRKFILDPQMGYAPVFTVEKSTYFGKPISHRQLAVTWKQQANVWIPVFVERIQNDSVDREHQTLTIDWQNVNQSVSHGEFDVFQMTESKPIFGIGHLPEALQQRLRARDTGERIRN